MLTQCVMLFPPLVSLPILLQFPASIPIAIHPSRISPSYSIRDVCYFKLLRSIGVLLVGRAVVAHSPKLQVQQARKLQWILLISLLHCNSSSSSCAQFRSNFLSDFSTLQLNSISIQFRCWISPHHFLSCLHGVHLLRFTISNHCIIPLFESSPRRSSCCHALCCSQAFALARFRKALRVVLASVLKTSSVVIYLVVHLVLVVSILPADFSTSFFWCVCAVRSLLGDISLWVSW
jgi:hypothetical protein